MERDWPREWPPERIAQVAHHEGEAAYLEPSEVVRLIGLPTGAKRIEPRTIIQVGGVFLIESSDEPDDWYMGQRASDGDIECWGKYDQLKGP